jgi:hypothetical protein
MARVWCEVTIGETEGEYGGMVAETVAECGRCGNETQAYGDSEASARRCMVAMREECPRGEQNYYVGDGADDAGMMVARDRRAHIEELEAADVRAAQAARAERSDDVLPDDDWPDDDDW